MPFVRASSHFLMEFSSVLRFATTVSFCTQVENLSLLTECRKTDDTGPVSNTRALHNATVHKSDVEEQRGNQTA